jgi:hypothetical protein
MLLVVFKVADLPALMLLFTPLDRRGSWESSVGVMSGHVSRRAHVCRASREGWSGRRTLVVHATVGYVVCRREAIPREHASQDCARVPGASTSPRAWCARMPRASLGNFVPLPRRVLQMFPMPPSIL